MSHMGKLTSVPRWSVPRLKAIWTMIALLLLLFCTSAILIFCASAIPRRQRRLKDWGDRRATEIARHQKWVSPYRLMNQAHLTKSDAQFVLRESCKEGHLYQAVNGRYYIDSLQGVKSGRGDSLFIKVPTESGRGDSLFMVARTFWFALLIASGVGGWLWRHALCLLASTLPNRESARRAPPHRIEPVLTSWPPKKPDTPDPSSNRSSNREPRVVSESRRA
jgi:hypothetical protein